MPPETPCRNASTHAFIISASWIGQPMTPRNTLPGRGKANCATTSQRPSSMNESISELACSRIVSSISAIRVGENSGSRILRYARWIGPSSSIGIWAFWPNAWVPSGMFGKLTNPRLLRRRMLEMSS